MVEEKKIYLKKKMPYHRFTNNNKAHGEHQQPQPKLCHRVYQITNMKVRGVHICSKFNSKRFANNLDLRDAVKHRIQRLVNISAVK